MSAARTPKIYRAEGDDSAHPFAGGWRVVSDDGMLCMNCTRGEAEMIATACNSHDALLELVRQYASECGECNGTGILTGYDLDVLRSHERPCGECAFIRAALKGAAK